MHVAPIARTVGKIVGYSAWLLFWAFVMAMLLMGTVFLSAFGPRAEKD